MPSFVDLGVSAPISRGLGRRGIESPFPIQGLVIPDALAGRDILARSRTGSGKTLAFAIPIVQRLEPSSPRPSALVLTPTRELAVQVSEQLHAISSARNLRVASVYGGVSLPKQAERASKAHVIVATPGRLQDLLERRLISIEKVSILVLDEADRMLDMGFYPQVDRIVRRLPEARQTMFFSATLDGTVGHLARAYTIDPVRHEVVEQKLVIAEAEHRFIPVDQHHKLDKLVGVLGETRDLALVFVRTKRGADRLQARLRAKGVKALAMHGDKTQGAREQALQRFANGKIDVLIATDVAARGLDLEDISHVINYDPPRDHKEYVHRVGRTARAGRFGTGVTFVGPTEEHEVSAIARQLDLKHEFQNDGLALATPRRVYSSRGSRSMMRSRQKRRF